MERTFKSKDVTKITGVTERNLRYWVEAEVFTPVKGGSGTQGIPREYSFENLVEITVLDELHKLRVETPKAREAVAQLREKNFGQKLFCYLLIAGGEIEVFTEEDLEEKFMLPMIYPLGDGKFGEWSDLMKELKESPQKIDSIGFFLIKDAHNYLGECIFNKETATLIVPVRSPQVKPLTRGLWDKVCERVSKLDGDAEI
jgi:DNA-binding transcriptional MerR regulator